VEQISDTGKVNTNHLKRLILTFVTEVSSMSIATVRIHKQSRVQSHEFYRFKSLQSACFVFVSRITIIVGGDCYLALERQILSVQHHQSIYYASPTVNIGAETA